MFGELLARFETCRSLAWPEYSKARFVEEVGDSCHQWRLRTDHGEIRPNGSRHG
jgi:hypothetical protein